MIEKTLLSFWKKIVLYWLPLTATIYSSGLGGLVYFSHQSRNFKLLVVAPYEIHIKKN